MEKVPDFHEIIKSKKFSHFKLAEWTQNIYFSSKNSLIVVPVSARRDDGLAKHVRISIMKTKLCFCQKLQQRILEFWIAIILLIYLKWNFHIVLHNMSSATNCSSNFNKAFHHHRQCLRHSRHRIARSSSLCHCRCWRSSSISNLSNNFEECNSNWISTNFRRRSVCKRKMKISPMAHDSIVVRWCWMNRRLMHLNGGQTWTKKV